MAAAPMPSAAGMGNFSRADERVVLSKRSLCSEADGAEEHLAALAAEVAEGLFVVAEPEDGVPVQVPDAGHGEPGGGFRDEVVLFRERCE